MKKHWKKILLGAAGLLAVLFLAFLYFVPPLTMIPQEEFISPYAAAVKRSMREIPNPVERLMADRGRYLVSVAGCNDCHTPQGDQGPDFDSFLSGGGMRMSMKGSGTAFARNLTPSPGTGLARRTDAEVLRVLEKGVSHDGRVFNPLFMPWGAFSHWTAEDRRAVLIYLRHLHPVDHAVPEWSPEDRSPRLEMSAGNFGISAPAKGK